MKALPEGCKFYISVYQPMAGWKAVAYCLNEEDKEWGAFWEPWQTSELAFSTEEQAIMWGKDWAQSEGVPFRYKEETEDD